MSIRTVQTSFTSASAFEHHAWSALTSPVASSRVLADVDMNYPRPSYPSTKRYPPGLGYYSVPVAAESSPALPSQPGSRPRRRSGSYHYGNIGDKSRLIAEFPALSSSPVSHMPQPTKRRFSFSRPSSTPSYRIPSPPIAAPSGPIKFDPFGSDDDSATSNPQQSLYNYNSQYNFPANFNTASPTRKSSLSSPSHIAYNIKLPSSPSVVSLPASLSSPVSVPLPLPKPDRNARSKLVAGILLNRIYAVGKPMRKRLPFGAEKEYVKSNLSRVITVD